MVLRLSAPAPLGVGDQRRHILALSGGGFRGLFTSKILERIETDAKAPCRACFDLICGTSVGGIIALALGLGISASEIRVALENHGPGIFRRRRFSVAGWARAKYKSDQLRAAIAAMVGEGVVTPLDRIDTPLLVVSVDQSSKQSVILASRGLAGKDAATFPIIEAALATSAAPTFFPAHEYDGRSYVDGGLVANAPDLVALISTMRWWNSDLRDIHLLSIGTAGIPGPRRAQDVGAAGRVSWLSRYGLFDLTITAQEELTQRQVRAVLGERFLRLDTSPSKPLRLDKANSSSIRDLLRMADDAYGTAKANNPDCLEGFLSYRVDS